MYQVLTYIKYEGVSIRDFTSLEEAQAYFDEVKPQLWSDDRYKVTLVKTEVIASADAEV